MEVGRSIVAVDDVGAGALGETIAVGVAVGVREPRAGQRDLDRHRVTPVLQDREPVVAAALGDGERGEEVEVERRHRLREVAVPVVLEGEPSLAAGDPRPGAAERFPRHDDRDAEAIGARAQVAVERLRRGRVEEARRRLIGIDRDLGLAVPARVREQRRCERRVARDEVVERLVRETGRRDEVLVVADDAAVRVDRVADRARRVRVDERGFDVHPCASPLRLRRVGTRVGERSAEARVDGEASAHLVRVREREQAEVVLDVAEVDREVDDRPGVDHESIVDEERAALVDVEAVQRRGQIGARAVLIDPVALLVARARVDLGIRVVAVRDRLGVAGPAIAVDVLTDASRRGRPGDLDAPREERPETDDEPPMHASSLARCTARRNVV
jgi:hypothetical protein